MGFVGKLVFTQSSVSAVRRVSVSIVILIGLREQ